MGMPGQERKRYSTKLISLNSFHRKNISSKFHWNLIDQLRYTLKVAYLWSNLGQMMDMLGQKVGEHVTELINLNVLSYQEHSRTYPESFIEIWFMNHDSPNYPAHFFSFWPFTREPEFSRKCGFREKLDTNNTFHFKPGKFGLCYFFAYIDPKL